MKDKNICLNNFWINQKISYLPLWFVEGVGIIPVVGAIVVSVFLKHLIATSSSWVQSCSPQARLGHISISDSVPVQLSSSSQMACIPLPNVLGITFPALKKKKMY